MKKFKLASTLLILALLCALLPSGADALDMPSISSRNAVLMNADTGEIFFDKSGSDTAYPASTTKIMTALLAIEAIERGEIAMDDVVTAYDDCQYNMDDDSSNAGPIIEPGEKMTVRALLNCAMLVSANEACNILAEYIAGSVNDFVERMNQRAQELGCTGTHFTNCNGLEDSAHYTTARDLAVIAREAMSHQQLLDICGATAYTVSATNNNSARELKNTNLLLDSSSKYYSEYAYGIKTGYYSAAGRCLVSGALYNDMNLICVVLGGEETDEEDESQKTRTQYEDTLTLYEWAWENYSHQQVLTSTATIAQLPVTLGTMSTVGVRAESGVSLLLPNDFDLSTLETQYVYYSERDGQTLEAPVSAGDKLGEVSVLRDGQTVGFSYLVATSTVEMSKSVYLKSQFGQVFQQPVVRRLITVVIIIFALYLILVCFYRVQRHRHLRSIREAKRQRAQRLAHEEFIRAGLPEDELSYLEGDDPDLLEEPDERPDAYEEAQDFTNDMSDEDFADLFRK